MDVEQVMKDADEIIQWQKEHSEEWKPQKKQTRHNQVDLSQVLSYRTRIENRVYDTQKAELLAYDLKDKYFDEDATGSGVYFEGLYKTAKGNYFSYIYRHEYPKSRWKIKSEYNHYQQLFERGKEFPYWAYDGLKIKLVLIENEVELVEA